MGRDGIQLLFVLTQVLSQGLEALGALLKIELEQVGQAHRAGVVHRITKVDGFGMGLVNRLAVEGAAQGLRAVLADLERGAPDFVPGSVLDAGAGPGTAALAAAQIWPDIVRYAQDHGRKLTLENCPMLFSDDEWPGGHNIAYAPYIWRRILEAWGGDVTRTDAGADTTSSTRAIRAYTRNRLITQPP